MNTTEPSTLARWQIDAIGIVGAILLSVGGYYAGVRPLMQQQHALSIMHSSTAEAHQLVAKTQSERQALTHELAALESDLAATAIQLVPADQLNRRLADLSEIAVESGLEIHESRSGEARDHVLYQSIGVEVSGLGSYPDCARFLHLLNQRLPDIAVLSLDLTGQPTRPGTPATFRFHLAWYAMSAVASAP